jgi:hypothetical protein
MPEIKQDENEFVSVLGELDGKGADAVVHVGGRTIEKAIPQININKWADECFLNFNTKNVEVDKQKFERNGDNVDLTVGDEKHRYYIRPDGKLEYEIHLASKPGTEVIEFDLMFSPDLQFSKQPTLQDEWAASPNIGMTLNEFLATHERPDNVINSYAVYWPRGSGWNEKKTGKVCHIYRPTLTDKNGNWIWAEWQLQHGETGRALFELRMDQAWLNQAVFPVVVGPTFGVTSVGGSQGGYGFDEMAVSAMSAPPSSGTTDTFHHHCHNDNGVDKNFCVGLYTQNAGPETLVGSEDCTQIGPWAAPWAWRELPCENLSVTKDTYYWLGLNGDDDVSVSYDMDAGGDQDRYYNDMLYPAAWPETHGKDSSSDAVYSSFITYTASGSGGSQNTQSVILSNTKKYTIPLWALPPIYGGLAIRKNRMGRRRKFLKMLALKDWRYWLDV